MIKSAHVTLVKETNIEMLCWEAVKINIFNFLKVKKSLLSKFLLFIFLTTAS